MRVYLAGPYEAEDIVVQERNIRRARQAAVNLIAVGHEVECSCLNLVLLQADDEGVLSFNDLQRNSLSKLENWAECICLLDGWKRSANTHEELLVAARLGLSVVWFTGYHRLDMVDFYSVAEEYAAAGEEQRECELITVLDERQKRLKDDIARKVWR